MAIELASSLITHNNIHEKKSQIMGQFGTLFLACFSIFLIYAPEAFGQRFYKAGYEIDIMWEVQSKKFKMWGDFEKGKSCERIDLKVQFKNYDTDQAVGMVTSTINSHRSKSRSWFRLEKETSTKRKKRSWQIKWFEFTCVNEEIERRYYWEDS